MQSNLEKRGFLIIFDNFGKKKLIKSDLPSTIKLKFKNNHHFFYFLFYKLTINSMIKIY